MPGGRTIYIRTVKDVLECIVRVKTNKASFLSGAAIRKGGKSFFFIFSSNFRKPSSYQGVAQCGHMQMCSLPVSMTRIESSAKTVDYDE